MSAASGQCTHEHSKDEQGNCLLSMHSAPVHPPLRLGPEQPFCSEPEMYDSQMGGAAQHYLPFTPSPLSDSMRRDGVLGHSVGSMAMDSMPRYGGGQPKPSFLPQAALPDSVTGSISTSAGSTTIPSLSYQSFNPGMSSNLFPQEQTLSNYPYNYTGMPTTRRLNDSASTMVAPTMAGITRDSYATYTPDIHRQNQAAYASRLSEHSQYQNLSHTHKGTFTPATTLVPGYSNSEVTMNYSGAQTDRSSNEQQLPFRAQENFCDITSDNVTVTPNIEIKVEKGFFLSPQDKAWTCYRRNYFSLNVSYGLTPWTPNARLYIVSGDSKQPQQIQAFALTLAAAVDQPNGKSIELIQHTPKRDKGPQLPMKKELLPPTPPGKSHDYGNYMGTYGTSNTTAGPKLPQQTESDPQPPYVSNSHATNSYTHGFERIQFKSATANNGKRRAQQQFYHLTVELHALLPATKSMSEQRWVKVATRSSASVVVRGRSPSHYSNDGQNTNASRGAGNGGPTGAGGSGYGSNLSYSRGYSNTMAKHGTSMMGGSSYRGGGNAYTLGHDPSPSGSHSVSAASSLNGSSMDGMAGDHTMTDRDDNKILDSQSQYQYYASPLYEHRAELPLPHRSLKQEYDSASTNSSWQAGVCGRFDSTDSSRGFYPDMKSTLGY